MSGHYQSTMRLRWIEVRGGVDDDVVRGMIPGWPECGPSYYKLQQWWMNTVTPGPDGEWRDIEVDHS